MKIGSRPVDQDAGVAPLSRASLSADAFGAGAGRALERLGQDVEQIAAFALELQKRKKKSEADIAYIEWEGEEQRRLADMRGNVQPGAAGLTTNTLETSKRSFDDFAKRVNLPPELRDEYETRYALFRQQEANKSFTFEFEESNRHLGDLIMKQADKGREAVYNEPELFKEKLQEIEVIIDESDLPPIMKEELKEKAYNQLAEASFLKENERAFKSQTPVRPADGTDVVAPNLRPVQRGLLNGVAGPESGNSFNIRYTPSGGAKFSSYADHPRIFEPGPKGPSSAAGRYQITATTWDDALRRMRAAGYEIDGTFSPINQDRVAVFLAQDYYARNSKTGRNLWEVLEEAAATGNREMLREVYTTLGGEGKQTLWAAFQNPKGFDKFANQVLGVRGAAGGGTPSSPTPDVFENPQYANLTYEDKIRLSQLAENTMLQQQQQVMREQQAREKDIETRIQLMLANGEAGVSRAVSQALAGGQIKDGDRAVRLTKMAEDERRDDQNVAIVADAIFNGRTLSGPDADAQLMSYIRRSGLKQGITENNPDAAAAIGQILQNTSALPKEVLSSIFAKATSASVAEQEFGMLALSELYRANPVAFAGLLTDDQRETAAQATSMFEFNATPQEAIAEWRRYNAPEMHETRRQLAKEADKLIAEMDPQEYLKKVTTWTERNIASLFGTAPTLPLRIEQNAIFRSDYNTIFKRQFIYFGGDEEKAHAATAKIIGNTYAPNPINGELMKYSPFSPGMGLMQNEGSQEYITRQVYEKADIPEGTDIAIVSTPKTIQDYRATGTPSYMIFRLDGQGNPLGTEVMLEPMSQEMLDERMRRADEESLRQREADLVRQVDEARRTLPRNSGASEWPWTLGPSPDLPELEKQLEEVRKQLPAKPSKAAPNVPVPTAAAPTISGLSKIERLRLLDAEMKKLYRDRTTQGRARLKELQAEFDQVRKEK